jgi:hypothetical protein
MKKDKCTTTKYAALVAAGEALVALGLVVNTWTPQLRKKFVKASRLIRACISSHNMVQ